MAPSESGYRMPIGKTSIIVIVAVVAVVWLFLSNMPPAPPKEQPRVIKINATPPPPQPQPQQPQQSVVDLFICRGEAYKMRNGITICGVEVVTDQYVFVRRGWIYAPNSTQFTLIGDVSTCRISVGVHTLHLNCTNYVMVSR
jgi:hypothetical protein